MRPLDLREAEAAFSIEKLWQSRGVGSALLGRTLLCARNRGIKHVQVSCLPQNKRMQGLARKFEAAFTFDYDMVVGTMENPNPTPLSIMQEMLADGHSFAAAYVDCASCGRPWLSSCRFHIGARCKFSKYPGSTLESARLMLR